MLNPYAKFAEGREPKAVIAETPERLEQVAGEIGAGKMLRAPAPGKWSARDILCHLADTEMVFAFRLRQTLSEQHHVIQPYDQERFAERYGQMEAADALKAFEAFRRWNIILIDGVQEREWAKPVTHPERGQMELSLIVETMAGHDLNHIGQLEKIRDMA
jgi:hypothetical protein